MNCKKMSKNLNLYIDNILDEKKSQVVKEHINACSRCSKDFNELLKIKNSLKSLNAVKAPDNIEDSIMEKINAKVHTPSTSSVFLFSVKTSLTAAVFLFCIMAAISFFNPGNKVSIDNIDALDYYVLKDINPYIKITNSLLG